MVSTPEVETRPHWWEMRRDCSDHYATLALGIQKWCIGCVGALRVPHTSQG